MTTQAILVTVIVVLSVLLVFVGAEVIMIILDLRRAIKKLNAILEDAILGGGLIRPEKLSGILEMIRKNKKMQSRGDNFGNRI